MIESGVIVYSFILAGIISAICFGVFIWVNIKDRDLDEEIYSKKKDIRNLVSKHKHEGRVEEESIGSLKKYSVSEKKEGEEKEKSSHRVAEEEEETLVKKDSIENEDQKLVEDDIISEPMSDEDYNKQFKPK